MFERHPLALISVSSLVSHISKLDYSKPVKQEIFSSRMVFIYEEDVFVTEDQ